MEEHDLGDEPEITKTSWQDHDWTAEEVTFVSKVLQHGNISRAARETWPGQYSSPFTQRKAGARLMEQTHVREYIATVRGEMAKAMELTKENVLSEVMLLAKSNMSDFLIIEDDGRVYTDFSNLTREQMAAISEVEIHTYVQGPGEEEGRPVKAVKFKLAPKLPALQLAGSYLKLWTEVLETNTSLGDQAAIMRARREQARTRRNEQPPEE